MYADAEQSVIVLVALLVCLIPTTIGALLSAIGIAGMDRLVQHNVLAMSGRAVEAAGDCSTLLLDKTGTITLGNRQAAQFLPLAGITEERLAAAAQLASLSDDTPEGRSIVVLAKQRFEIRERDLSHAQLVPFSAQTRMSGVDLNGHSVRKGAGDAVKNWVVGLGGTIPEGLNQLIEGVATSGGTPLVVAEGTDVLGVIHLKDVVKEGIRNRFDQLRQMGIRTVMITGDNPLTAQAIATEAGVDDFLAEATPEEKMALIRREQSGGRLVAMTGDGTNDAPALAQADVGVSMNTGTQAAKEAGNMVDLDSNPTKLIEIVEIGKQLLITRGALTTFSIANDVAKYFAIIPAMFVGVLPVLDRAERDGPGHTPDRDPLRRHLQCPDHHRPDPSRLARGEVPGAGRVHDAAPQPVDLRPRRDRRSLHRDQGHRPSHHCTWSLLMLRQLRSAFVMVVIFTVITGVAYPLLVTGIAQAGFGEKADGSLVESDGEVVGSRWIGQTFSGGEYFHPRPSATGYSPGPDYAFGSNYGPTNEAWLLGEDDPETPDLDESVTTGVDDLIRIYREENGLDSDTPVPVDAVTGSGSSLDPHISIANARLQAPRVAAARGLDEAVVLDLIEEHTEGRDLGFLGEPGVNVLLLNLALDGAE